MKVKAKDKSAAITKQNKIGVSPDTYAMFVNAAAVTDRPISRVARVAIRHYHELLATNANQHKT